MAERKEAPSSNCEVPMTLMERAWQRSKMRGDTLRFVKMWLYIVLPYSLAITSVQLWVKLPHWFATVAAIFIAATAYLLMQCTGIDPDD